MPACTSGFTTSGVDEGSTGMTSREGFASGCAGVAATGALSTALGAAGGLTAAAWDAAPFAPPKRTLAPGRFAGRREVHSALAPSRADGHEASMDCKERRMKVPAVMRSTILALAVLATSAAWGDPPAAEPSQKEIDAIVRKLETSGALDAALDRAIDRYAKRQQEAQRAAREKLEAQLAKAVPSVDPKRDHVRGPADAE